MSQRGIEYIYEKGDYEQGGFKDSEYFRDANEELARITLQGYGSPVNTKDMKESIGENSFIKFSGNFSNPGDFVAERIGGNEGENGSRGFIRLTDPINPVSYFDLYKLFTESSPHSNYKCNDLKGAQCGGD